MVSNTSHSHDLSGRRSQIIVTQRLASPTNHTLIVTRRIALAGTIRRQGRTPLIAVIPVGVRIVVSGGPTTLDVLLPPARFRSTTEPFGQLPVVAAVVAVGPGNRDDPGDAEDDGPDDDDGGDVGVDVGHEGLARELGLGARSLGVGALLFGVGVGGGEGGGLLAGEEEMEDGGHGG